MHKHRVLANGFNVFRERYCGFRNGYLVLNYELMRYLFTGYGLKKSSFFGCASCNGDTLTAGSVHPLSKFCFLLLKLCFVCLLLGQKRCNLFRRCRLSELLLEQEVHRVAVGHVFNLMRPPNPTYILKKYDLHASTLRKA